MTDKLLKITCPRCRAEAAPLIFFGGMHGWYLDSLPDGECSECGLDLVAHYQAEIDNVIETDEGTNGKE